MMADARTDRPVVSVIIVNWNTRKLLQDCLASLPLGFPNSSYETFVVDNGSTDGSQDMVREQFPQVTLIQNPRNLGFAAANNIALRQAGGEFFLLLNSDTVLTPGAIDTLVDYLRSHPQTGFCGPQLLNGDGSLQNSVANFPSLATELGQKALLKALFPKRFYSKKFTSDMPVVVESLVGAALMARREMTDCIGFYDEDFFFFFEETEWCRRGMLAGWKCELVPHARVYHLQGQTAKQVPVAVRVEYWRSRYTYFRKQGSVMRCALLRTGLLLRCAGTLLLNLPCAPLSQNAAQRVALCKTIFSWHLKGCPPEMGLSVPRQEQPPSQTL